MIEKEFSSNQVQSVNLNVCIKPDKSLHFIGTDASVQEALKRQLEETVLALNSADDDWQTFDITEDYGTDRKVFALRSDDMWKDLSNLYDVSSLAPLEKPLQKVPAFIWYFVEFFDEKKRKLVGIKRATHFKMDVGAQSRLVRWADDSLTTVPGAVFRLDKTFDALISSKHIFILNPRQTEYIAGLENYIASAATDKLGSLEATVAFLDLSRLKTDIDEHPRKARLAIAIAGRTDLDSIVRSNLVQAATEQGIKFKTLPDDRLQVRRQDEFKLLELLDNRRYATKITTGDPLLFRATARQRVSKNA